MAYIIGKGKKKAQKRLRLYKLGVKTPRLHKRQFINIISIKMSI